MKIPVLLTDSELLYVAGVTEVLRAHPSLQLAPTLRDQGSLEAALHQHPAAIVVVALTLVTDLPQLSRNVRENRGALVLLLSAAEQPSPEQVLLVQGLLRRSADAAHLVACLESVRSGKNWTEQDGGGTRRTKTPGRRVLEQLSPRQIQVIQGVSHGAKNAAIARTLGTSEQVVKNMLRDIYDMTGVSDRLSTLR